MAMKDVKKAIITLSLGEDWRSLATRRIEIPIIIDPDASVSVNMQTFAEAMGRLFSDLETLKRTLSPNNYISLLMEASAASDIRQAVEKEAEKHKDGGEVWKLQAKITEMQTELARSKCQLDGLIKGVNPNFDPKAYESSPELNL